VTNPVGLLVCLPLVLLPSASAGAVLPEHYPPQLDSRTGPQVDPDLKSWLGDHVDQLQVPLLDEPRYQKLAASGDKLMRLFVELQRGPGIIKGSRIQEIGAAVDQEVAIAKKEARAVHPMLPYIIQALVVRGFIPDSEVNRFESMLLDVSPRSCPGRRVFLKSIARERLDRMSDAELVSSFTRIRDFRFGAYRRQAYDVFFSNLSGPRRDALKPAIAPVVGEIEPAMARHSWLAGLVEGISGDKTRKPLVRIKEEVKDGRCKEAATLFNDVLEKEDSFFGGSKSAGVVEDLLSAGQNIGRCLRRRGVQPAIAFWTSAMPRLEKIFGFPGKAGALQRMASLYWNADQMEEAKALARQFRDEAKAAKDDARHDEATFLLARILDDNRERKEAKELYAGYVARYPNHENFEPALTALTLMRFEDGEHKEIIESLSSVIRKQDMLPAAKKSASLLGFSLFWSGRTQAALKRHDLALHNWRRLSSELYSTYYGVLGHVMHERTTNKKYVIEPSRTPRFSADFLFEPFSGEDRSTMVRIAGLLRAGLSSEAICELREVATNEADPDQTASRAMALYSGKEWLDAIKLMDSLPRAYRNALPAGFERIFFPRDHENLVHDYSRRLGVDPDFIFAIIRQESVFNPKAQSPVGATGLMQLMPATARGEMQKLSRGYVGPEKREKLARAMRDRNNLNDPELNVALGVHHVHRLMANFKNPVLMLSAYNASPSAADKWSREIPFDDPLIAVERIPYQETRNYVKLIMRNYFYYKRWYVTAKPQTPYLDFLLAKVIKN
jgi:soluble lytic murein transglycosylase-like protein